MLGFPKLLLAALCVGVLVAGYFAARFSFDASSDTLVVENDPDLLVYQEIASVFAGDEFLLLTFSPLSGDPLDDTNLGYLAELQASLEEVDGVASVFSVLDVPLLQSPPVPLSEMADGFKTLGSPGVDKALARSELLASPLFRELLITSDAATTAMRVNLVEDQALKAVSIARESVRAALPPGAPEREHVERRYAEVRVAFLENRDELIGQIRAVRDSFKDRGVAYIGGLPMIASDMIAFVKTDLVVFGGTVVVLIMGALYLFFHQARWVFVPVASCAITIVASMGVLGFLERPATVISSNFISLIAITNISLIIHLIVRYRELLRVRQSLEVRELVLETMLSKFAPCLYTALTTMAAFGSLISSNIVPVEDFGWMMCLGIAVGFVVTFTFVPAVLLLMNRGEPTVESDRDLGITRLLSGVAQWRSTAVLAFSVVLVGFVAYGVSRVSLDNRFVDYFKPDTEIYQGMNYIDRYLGGTVPLDVVVRFAAYEPLVDSGDDDFFDDFADEEEDSYPERYWFTTDKVDVVQSLHDYIDSRPETGKVLSISSLERLGREFNDGEPLSNAVIAAVLGLLPDDLKAELIAPYASPQTGMMRINARIVETGLAFDREELANSIRAYAGNELSLDPEQIEVTGMMVLFNSMLKQLFSSQIDSLMYVLLATGIMFLVLLRSLKFAILGLIPNVISAGTVIGFMGFAGIPLDMMTTTIAAISIGIGVDDTIHYLHRFREEHRRWGDVRVAIAWCHASIGRAMYFTTLTVVIGFSVLVFSKFVPTTMFGVLTAIAMAIALLANLTILPSLLVKFVRDRDPADVAEPIQRPTGTRSV
jgi:predicted RND superfamily exporter protein